MAEVKEPNNVAQEPVEERPNRKRYQQMFNEDYPDVDFEDKEARYGKMAEDRERYREYQKSGRALSEVFDNNRWLAWMFQDLRENPDLDPITWMADQGIDINEAMQNEEYAKKISQKIADFQANKIKGEEAVAQRDENFKASAETLDGLREEYGLDEEQTGQIWADFFNNVIGPALVGTITEDTWRMVMKARNYDDDIKKASEQSAMKARNEKVTNMVKKPNVDIPPTLPQGGNQRAARPQQREESLMDFVKKNR